MENVKNVSKFFAKNVVAMTYDNNFYTNIFQKLLSVKKYTTTLFLAFMFSICYAQVRVTMEEQSSVFSSVSNGEIVDHPNSQAYFDLANLCQQKNDFLQASEYYKKGIECEPNRLSNIKRYHQLGICLFYSNKNSEACNAFNSCMDVAFKNKNKIDIIMSSTDTQMKEVVSEFLFLSLDAELWTARLTSDATEAVRKYKRIMEDEFLKKNVIRDDYFQYALACKSLNEIENANRILDLGLNIYKDDPELSFAKALYSPDGIKKIDLFKGILLKEDNYKPRYFDYGTVCNNIAWGYCLLKEYTEGLLYAQKAVQKNPEHGYSWETLGELCFYLGRYQECIDAMTKCISCGDKEQYKSAYEMRGKAYLRLNKKKLGMADLAKARTI